MSVTNFQFKSTRPPGQTGSFDQDNPSLDKAVGRSADKKWTKINQDRDIKAKIRRESGTNSLTKISEGNYQPVSNKAMKVRNLALNQLKKVKQSSE